MSLRDQLVADLVDLERQVAGHQEDWCKVLPALLEIGDSDPCHGGTRPCPWCASWARPDDRIPLRPRDHATQCPYRHLAEFAHAMRKAEYSGVTTAESVPSGANPGTVEP